MEMKMANVGSVDRALRFVFGLTLLALPFLPFMASMFDGWGAWRFVVALVGGVVILTALLRFCPAYLLFGVRTCAIRNKP